MKPGWIISKLDCLPVCPAIKMKILISLIAFVAAYATEHSILNYWDHELYFNSISKYLLIAMH